MCESKKLSGWKNRSVVLQEYPIGWRKLEQFVTNGWVRSYKNGTDKRCNRLYKIDDIENVLLCFSKNQTPKKLQLTIEQPPQGQQ